MTKPSLWDNPALFGGTSTNNGANWKGVNTGLPIIPGTGVSSFAISGTNLFAGTYTNGVWRRPLSEMIPTGVDERQEQIPYRFALEQNYPNPFNPTTVISYQLAMNSHVTLKVYDILGREVATLVNEEKLAGRYSVQWNAEGFASGMYFCRIQTRDYTSTIKLLLQK